MRRPASVQIALAVLAVAAGTSPASAQTSREAEVDALFADFDRTDAPGVAIVVVRDGEVLYRKGFGMADLEHGVPISPGTVFDIASVSKQFAGFSIAQLVESGAVDLTDDIREHLPEMPAFEHTITVDHLVHHTSGLRDWPGTLAMGGWRMDDVISFAQILRMARNQQDLNFEPGAEYSYSNTGYNLLAELVSRVSGQTFRAWTDENIFRPLGMGDTHFHDDHTEIVRNRAQGYGRIESGFTTTPNGLTALGSSSLYTTVDDLAKWVMNFDDGSVGGAAVIERMEQQGVLNNGLRIPYAFGQSVGGHRAAETWSHTGSWAGFRTVLTRFPEHRFGVVILSNLGTYNPAPVALRIADIYLDDALAPPVRQPDPPVREEMEQPGAPPTVTLEAYVGEYYSEELDTSYRLSIVDGALIANHRRHGDIVLTPVGQDMFTSDAWFAPEIGFDRDERGEVSGLRMTQGRSRNVRFIAR